MTAATTTTVTVQLRYFAAAAEAAGVAAEDLTLPAGATAADLTDLLAVRHGSELGRILGISSLLVDDVVREEPDAPLAAADRPAVRVDVLPPFAGG